MFGWLRDAFANAPSSLSGFHPSVTPSTLFRPRKVVESTRSPSSGSDDDLSQSKDTSFYHNPYHSSGQMNYADLPQQQYSNERTYPTYLAHQQTIAETDEPPIALDEQIHSKLVSLHQRSNDLQCYAHRQNNYAYRNRSFAAPSTRQSSLISDREHSLPSDGDDDEEEDEERTSSVGTYAGIPGYYSGPYSTGDDEFDLASVVFWYRNMMQSVKKLLPTHPPHHQQQPSSSSENNNNEDDHHSPLPPRQVFVKRKGLPSSSKVKWFDAVKTVTQLNQMVSYNQLFFSLPQQQLMIDRSILFSLSLFPIAPLMMNDPPNKSSQWMRLYFPCSSTTLDDDDDDDDQEELEWDRSDLSLPISSSFSRLSTFGVLRLYVQKYTEKISTLVAELFQSDNIDDDDDEADQLDLDTYDIL